MSVLEKASYLRGLADGLGIDSETKEGKLLLAMIDVIDELSATVADLEDVTDEICGELDEVAEELLELEGTFDDCGCDCDDCHDDCDCDCDDECDCCGEDDFHYEVVCPTCGEATIVDEGILELGSIKCPNCDEELEFDIEDID